MDAETERRLLRATVAELYGWVGQLDPDPLPVGAYLTGGRKQQRLAQQVVDYERRNQRRRAERRRLRREAAAS